MFICSLSNVHKVFFPFPFCTMVEFFVLFFFFFLLCFFMWLSALVFFILKTKNSVHWPCTPQSLPQIFSLFLFFFGPSLVLPSHNSYRFVLTILVVSALIKTKQQQYITYLYVHPIVSRRKSRKYIRMKSM